MTQLEFNEVFNLLCANYPNTKNKDKMGTLYFLALGNELTKQEFLNAALKIIKTSKSGFMPQIAEILECAKGITDVENQVILAKKMLKSAFSKAGSCGMVAFEDKGIHAVIDFIGWRRLCEMEQSESENFFKFQFDGIYKGFLERPYEVSPYFAGRSQLYGQTEPYLITYQSIGINAENLKFIPLDYKPTTNRSLGMKENIKKLQNKMLIGGPNGD